jgi:hypothetical protein
VQPFIKGTGVGAVEGELEERCVRRGAFTGEFNPGSPGYLAQEAVRGVTGAFREFGHDPVAVLAQPAQR